MYKQAALTHYLQARTCRQGRPEWSSCLVAVLDQEPIYALLPRRRRRRRLPRLLSAAGLGRGRSGPLPLAPGRRVTRGLTLRLFRASLGTLALPTCSQQHLPH